MKREVKIGIFTIVIIACSWAGIRFLSGIDVFGRNVDYYASYQTINGISNASSVMIQGVKVGSVSEVILDPSSSNQVTLKLSIKRRYKIPKNSTARIYSPGLMSSMAIGLTLGDSDEYLEEGDNITSLYEAGLMDVAAEKLTALSDQISGLSTQLSTTLTSINTLLESNSGNVDQTLTNLNSISKELSELLASQSSNIENIVSEISKFSTSLGGNADSLDKLIANLGKISEELSEAELGKSLGATLGELKTTLGKVNSAEGSAGKLLSDEELYENLAGVSGSLNALIVDMQANPKRYVHFSLFGAKEGK